MKNVTVTPSGLAPGKNYKMEVYLASAPSNLIYSRDNIITGASVTFPVSVPGTYLIKLFNSEDLLNICETTPYNEQTIQVLFPLVTYNASDTDCSTETYTVTYSVSNPTTAGAYKFGWGNSTSCTTATWITGDTVILPSDGNDKYLFVSYDDCCQTLAKVNRSPCISCNIVIDSIVTSCNSNAPIPVPEEECKTYSLHSLDNGFVYYIDCTTSEVRYVTMGFDEVISVCSFGVPTTNYSISVSLVGNNCPS